LWKLVRKKSSEIQWNNKQWTNVKASSWQYIKQWEKLHPSVLARIPIHTNFDTRYFTDKYQVLPKEGYTRFFENLLNHSLIQISLNMSFEELQKNIDVYQIYDAIIYTGPIDQYIKDSNHPKLEYRSIDFQYKRLLNIPYY
jgi:UDP-galactopyranose mutase